jgi:hypothetical protein
MTVRRVATVGGVVVAVLVVLMVAALAVLWFAQRDRTLPNTSVAGIEVSGMTEAEVRGAIEPLVVEREGTPISFTFEDATYAATAEDLGYRVDHDAMVASAVGRGRDTGLISDAVERVRSLRGQTRDLPLVEMVDEATVTGWVADVAAEVDRDAFPGSITIDPDELAVVVEPPIGRVAVEREPTTAVITDTLLEGGPAQLELPVDADPPPVTASHIDAVVAQVERAIAQPLELTSEDGSLTLEPEDLARLIDVEVTATSDGVTRHELVVTASSVEDELGEIGPDRFDRSPVDARFVTRRNPPRTLEALGTVSFRPVAAEVSIERGRSGARFVAELTAEQLTGLLRAGTRTAEIELESVTADLTNAAAEELRPTHLLGTFTSGFPAGRNRSFNIQRLADVIDGALVLPGEQFSIQDISGPRNCDQGYLQDGTIVRGELVDTCGGGVSQFGTTMFNAAFFSGLRLDDWKAHSWYISRYPMGREATLYYPYLDVKFTNTSDGAVLVKTAHTDTSVTVSIYGQPVAEQVTARHGQPFNPRPHDRQRRTTDELPAGSQRVFQAGIDGFTVDVERIIERTDGTTDSRSYRTVYEPATEIIEVGG